MKVRVDVLPPRIYERRTLTPPKYPHNATMMNRFLSEHLSHASMVLRYQNVRLRYQQRWSLVPWLNRTDSTNHPTFQRSNCNILKKKNRGNSQMCAPDIVYFFSIYYSSIDKRKRVFQYLYSTKFCCSTNKRLFKQMLNNNCIEMLV